MAAGDLLLDPRYPDFVDRYHADLPRFAVEVCGMQPSADQEDLFYAMIAPTAKVSVVSGTSTGKTAAFARIAMWSLLCHPYAVVDGKLEIGSNTYIAAPVVKQVAEGVWKEMKDAVLAIASGPHAWILQYVSFNAEKIYIHGYSEGWFITQLALKKGEAVTIAGKHRYWQLIIVDEAAGVTDEHMNVIEGTQTSPGNRTLLASQGVRNVGRFYDSHHSLRVENGGSWVSLCFSSERSPFVTNDWLKQRAIESGGRTSVEYRIRVLGQFADDSANVLLSREDIERIFEPRAVPLIAPDEPWGYLTLGDVAMGEYRDESVALVAKCIGWDDFGPEAMRVEFCELAICSAEKNEIDFAGDLLNLNGRLDNSSLYVDNGGVGATVNKLIERSGGVVNRIDWGKPCFKRAYQARFYNLRACAQVRFRDAVKQGRVSWTAPIDQRTKQKIIDQATRLPYEFAEAGGLRYKMMRKEDMRKEGIKSPDITDAMSFPFLEGVAYVAHSGTSEAGAVGAKAAAIERILARRRALAAQLGQQDDGGDVAVADDENPTA